MDWGLWKGENSYHVNRAYITDPKTTGGVTRFLILNVGIHSSLLIHPLSIYLSIHSAKVIERFLCARHCAG